MLYQLSYSRVVLASGAKRVAKVILRFLPCKDRVLQCTSCPVRCVRPVDVVTRVRTIFHWSDRVRQHNLISLSIDMRNHSVIRLAVLFSAAMPFVAAISFSQGFANA